MCARVCACVRCVCANLGANALCFADALALLRFLVTTEALALSALDQCMYMCDCRKGCVQFERACYLTQLRPDGCFNRHTCTHPCEQVNTVNKSLTMM